MTCPVCDVPPSMADRQGVAIDFFPQCRGVWLDRGELDKIIERSAAETAPGPPRPRKAVAIPAAIKAMASIAMPRPADARLFDRLPDGSNRPRPDTSCNAERPQGICSSGLRLKRTQDTQ